MTTRFLTTAAAALMLMIPVSHLRAQDAGSTTAVPAPPKTMMDSCEHHETTAAAIRAIEKLVANNKAATDTATLQSALNQIGGQVVTLQESAKKCAGMMEMMKMKMTPQAGAPAAGAPAQPHH